MNEQNNMTQASLASPTHKPAVVPMSSLWSTVRFRRAKKAKAWTLIGIPSQIYPLVAYRLFELKAQFLEKYEKDSFVSVLFKASPAVVARLALTFPAPPRCDGLRVAQRGDRILTGKAAQSDQVLQQAVAPEDKLTSPSKSPH